MELTDYDILGVNQKATFRVVKNAYYELSRIYHPDSSQIILGMTREERLIAFQRIQKAYENIKEKLNIVEVDLPKEEIEYTDDKFDKPVIIKNKLFNNISGIDTEEFNKKFNAEFEKEHKNQNKDNPFSINYEEPKENEKNLPDSKLILKEYTNNKIFKNIHEFGINYIEDHSCENYHDIRHLNNSNNLNNVNNVNEIKVIKEEVDLDFDKKLDELIKMRDIKIEMTEKELNFINRQRNIQNEIEESKRKVNHNRNKYLLK